MKMKYTLILLLLGTCAWQSSAQSTLDSTGNGMLNGTYYMRQVFYVLASESNAIVENVTILGNITFDGAGGYTFNGTVVNNTSNPVSNPLTSSGDYSVSGSGEGYIGAIDTSFSIDQIIGTVSHGVFIGSTTETGSGLDDLFIAAPVGSEATNATLKGAYTIAYFDPTFPGDALLTLNADGQGGIGTVSVTSYIGASSTAGSPIPSAE